MVPRAHATQGRFHMQRDQTTRTKICSRYIQRGTTLPTPISPTQGGPRGANLPRAERNLNLASLRTTWTVHSSNSRWLSCMQVSHKMSFLHTTNMLFRITTTWCHPQPVQDRDDATSHSATLTASNRFPTGLRTSNNSPNSSRLPLLHRLLTTTSLFNSHLRIRAAVRR